MSIPYNYFGQDMELKYIVLNGLSHCKCGAWVWKSHEMRIFCEPIYNNKMIVFPWEVADLRKISSDVGLRCWWHQQWLQKDGCTSLPYITFSNIGLNFLSHYLPKKKRKKRLDSMKNSTTPKVPSHRRPMQPFHGGFLKSGGVINNQFFNSH